jgi:hypothetical protein
MKKNGKGTLALITLTTDITQYIIKTALNCFPVNKSQLLSQLLLFHQQV